MIHAAIFRILFEMLSSPVALEISSSVLILEGVTSLITKEQFSLFKSLPEIVDISSPRSFVSGISYYAKNDNKKDGGEDVAKTHLV